MPLSRRALLVGAVWCMIGIGIVGYFTPLLLSFGPNAKAEPALPIIDVSRIMPGQTRFEEHPLYGAIFRDYKWSILFYRHTDGKLSAWDVVTENGVLVMPDWDWWRPSGQLCQNFSPVPDQSDGVTYQCNDLPKIQWYSELQWDIEGKNIAGGTGDMLATRGELKGGKFKVGKLSH